MAKKEKKSSKKEEKKLKKLAENTEKKNTKETGKSKKKVEKNISSKNNTPSIKTVSKKAVKKATTPKKTTTTKKPGVKKTASKKTTAKKIVKKTAAPAKNTKNSLTNLSIFFASIKEKTLTDIFADLLTEKEIQEFAERIEILKQLKAGTPQRTIAQNLGISVTTVSRGSKVLQKGKQTIKKYL